MDWIPPKLFVDVLSERVAAVLIEVRQPSPRAFISQTIRGLLFHKRCVKDGGLVLWPRYWRRFLRDRAKRLRRGLRDEVHQRILFALGQFELAELAPRHWRPVPELDEASRAILEAALVEGPSDRFVALAEGFDTGLFDFVGDLLATTYSVHGRRGYHPVFMWKVVLAMLASGETEPATFLHRVNDSLQLRLFLEVMSTEELPSARRIKGFPIAPLSRWDSGSFCRVDRPDAAQRRF